MTQFRPWEPWEEEILRADNALGLPRKETAKKLPHKTIYAIERKAHRMKLYLPGNLGRLERDAESALSSLNVPELTVIIFPAIIKAVKASYERGLEDGKRLSFFGGKK